MSIRWFYDCPIEAAYMMKNFSVLIEGDNCEREFLKHIQTLEIRNKYYLDPGSIKLLEPLRGDLIELKAISVVTIYDIGKKGRLYYRYGTGCIDSPRSELKRIVQRNNKPFIWPKREVV